LAHNLATTNDKPAMMYTGEVPWHQLGTKLDKPPTAKEAIQAAGLNYQVDLVRIATLVGQPVDQRRATVRDDTKEVLGIVGNSYIPVQNHQAFGFLDAVVAEGNLRYHTAGALGRGERIWLLAELPNQIRIKQSDETVDKFLLLTNSHDGSSALRVYFTPIRVVCQNTLNLAESKSKGQGVSIRHQGNLHAKIKEAQRVLGLAYRFYDDAEAKINFLANHYPTKAQAENYFKLLYPNPGSGDSTRTNNIRTELMRLFEQGIGHDQQAIRGTTWAAYNAVTEWVDHHRPTRNAIPEMRANNRLKSAWFGSGAKLKARAWETALELATIG
jgi:phage/plasmid-like protein (TIGR03299 family)